MTGWPPGVGKSIFETVDSTNEEVRRQLAKGREGPFWIAARRQTAGRGRQGRGWSSEPGNLAATYLTPVEGGASAAALLSFVAALAVGDCLQVLAPGQAIALKWPNDVLLNGRKASGILLESFSRSPDVLQVAIGIGVNLAHSPPAEASNWVPTSIKDETGTAPDFETALEVLALALAARLDQHRTQGFATTREAWLARAANLGREIQVRLPAETLTGRFDGLDATGALVLGQPGGNRLIAAGDVFFPEAA